MKHTEKSLEKNTVGSDGTTTQEEETKKIINAIAENLSGWTFVEMKDSWWFMPPEKDNGVDYRDLTVTVDLGFRTNEMLLTLPVLFRLVKLNMDFNPKTVAEEIKGLSQEAERYLIKYHKRREEEQQRKQRFWSMIKEKVLSGHSEDQFQKHKKDRATLTYGHEQGSGPCIQVELVDEGRSSNIKIYGLTHETSVDLVKIADNLIKKKLKEQDVTTSTTS